MPKSVKTGQLQQHWETRKIAIQMFLMKSQQEQREPPQLHLAVLKQKVTSTRASQHPESTQMNYVAEAQHQKWEYDFRNEVSMAKP